MALLALVGSLGANAYLVTRPPPHALKPQVVETLERDDPGDRACTAQLEACQKTTTGLALTVWQSAWRAASTADAAPPIIAPSEPPKPRDSLCRIAKDKLREDWLAKQDSITAAIVDDLTDAERQRADALRDATSAASMLGVSGRARQSFEEDFVDLRQKQMAELAASLEATPIDWSAMLDGAKSLFAGEDALVQQDLGADASAKYRDSESDKRATILSILATYADVDWDEAMGSR
jgi:hypothetical protein